MASHKLVTLWWAHDTFHRVGICLLLQALGVVKMVMLSANPHLSNFLPHWAKWASKK